LRTGGRTSFSRLVAAGCLDRRRRDFSGLVPGGFRRSFTPGANIQERLCNVGRLRSFAFGRGCESPRLQPSLAFGELRLGEPADWRAGSIYGEGGAVRCRRALRL